MSMKQGIIPKEWKCANVVPVYKSGGKSDPNNYRPISLLSIISKVMESIINDKLRKHVFGLRLISDNQYGFRPNHSTLDLLTVTTQKWANALDKGQEVKVVALDISRAFDSVWHKGLLSKIMSLGIGGSLYRWIREFLINRVIRVVMNGCQSSVGPVNCGVPRGSILGPTLFLIFINDLCDTVKSDINMFADDTTISVVVPNVSSRLNTVQMLNEDLREIEFWAEKWLVTFNAKKTQLLHISRKHDTDDTKVFFLNETLVPEDTIKLLGVHISKTMDWTLHVADIAKRAGQCLGMIRKAKHLLNPEGLSTLYKTKVQSVMEYCGPVWQSAHQTELHKLDTIQRRACKLMGGNGDIIPELNVQSLSHRRKVSGLCQIHRMVSGTAPRNVRQMLPLFNEPNRYSRHVAQSHHFQFKISKSRTCSHQDSFIPQFTRCWNELSNDCIYDIKGNLKSLQSFKVFTNIWLLGRLL
jgi:hypothetical protein